MFRPRLCFPLTSLLIVALSVQSSFAFDIDEAKTLNVPLRPLNYQKCIEGGTETFLLTDTATNCPCTIILRKGDETKVDGDIFIMREDVWNAYDKGSDKQHAPYSDTVFPLAAETEQWETRISIQEEGPHVVVGRLQSKGESCMDVNYIFTKSDDAICPTRLKAMVGNPSEPEVPPVETKVIHGTSVFDPIIQKFMVGVYTPGKGACTGTVIGEKWVLTAAHCEPEVNSTRLFIGGDSFSSGYEVKLEDMICHPKFSSGVDEIGTVVEAVQNDLCLLKTRAEIKSPKIYIANNANIPKERDIVRAAGYGLSFKDETRGALNVVDVAETPIDECIEAYEKVTAANPLQGLNSRVHICAGPDEICSGGVCRGDSGGPIMIKVDDAYAQVGVVSFGLDCAYKSYAPDVYARLSYFAGWIESETNGEVETVDPTREVIGSKENTTEGNAAEYRLVRRRRRTIGLSVGAGVLFLILLIICIGAYFFVRRRDSRGGNR